MSPPVAPATPASGGTTSAVTPGTLTQDACLFMEAAGIHRSPSWASRVVRDYLRSAVSGLPFAQYLAVRLDLNAQQRARIRANSALRYVLDYADPTGEAAVRHVMAARR